MRSLLARVVLAGALAWSAGAEAASDDAAGTASLLDVPYVAQTEALCGGASVAMVQRFWGARGVSPAAFVSLVDPRHQGISTSALVDAVQLQGWQAFPLSGTAALARHYLDSGRPLIALLEVGPHRRHYVVVVSWTSERVVYHDPATLPFRSMSPAAFDKLWAPTSRWALLLLPSSMPTHREEPDREADEPTPPSCANALESGATLAAAGKLSKASAALATAQAACPESAAPLIEIAGIHLLQHNYVGAVAAATDATRLAPDSTRAWRVLAVSLFLSDRTEPALSAWNRAGGLTLDLVKIDGLTRTRYGAVEHVVGLTPGSELTPSAMGLARRRLESVPALSASRLEYVPTGAGLSDVRASVVERPAVPSGLMSLAVLGARAAIGREVEWTLSSPTRNGETITAAWRFWESRPRVALSARIPVSGWVQGVVGLSAEVERQGYALVNAGPDDVFVSRHRSARASFEQWLVPNTRWEVSAGVDRWLDTGTFATIGGGLEQRGLGDRAAFAVRAQLWPGSGGFTSVMAGTRWRSSQAPVSDLLLIDANGVLVSEWAPQDIWPGAGTGCGRRILLRAHPMLDEGIVRSEAFGHQLAQASTEWRHHLPSLAWFGSAKLQIAAFVDAGRAWDGPATRDRVLVDTGAGMRIGIAGQGALRIDFAHGVTDGANAVSVGLEAPWPRLR